MGASEPRATAAVRALLTRHAIPAVGTFQGPGVVSRELLPLFFGRVGPFRNQPGDKVLARGDVVLTIGYDPVEYDPSFWNVGKARAIIHLDSHPCDIDNHGWWIGLPVHYGQSPVAPARLRSANVEPLSICAWMSSFRALVVPPFGPPVCPLSIQRRCSGREFCDLDQGFSRPRKLIGIGENS
jgi:Thiamine pyrophosphate enzyme, central domain